MSQQPLIRMGNQIATFFESYPDQQEAMQELAQHLKKFWAPSMRHDLLAQLDGGATGAHPLLLQAIQSQRALLE